MKFIAKHDDKELIVDEKMFKSSNLSKLVNLLNKSGFSLGSGHDGMEMKKINDDYEFILIPYIGHPVQHVSFTKIKDDFIMTRQEQITKILDIKLKNDKLMSEDTKKWILDLLNEFSIDQLEDELEEAEKTLIPIPTLINHEEIDFEPLKRELDDYINWVSSDDYHDDSDGDWKQGIYETTLITFYGKKIFEYLNNI